MGEIPGPVVPLSKEVPPPTEVNVKELIARWVEVANRKLESPPTGLEERYPLGRENLTAREYVRQGFTALPGQVAELVAHSESFEPRKRALGDETAKGVRILGQDLSGRTLFSVISGYLQHPLPGGRLPTDGTFQPQVFLAVKEPIEGDDRKPILPEMVKRAIAGVNDNIENAKKDNPPAQALEIQGRMEAHLAKLYRIPLAELQIAFNQIRWDDEREDTVRLTSAGIRLTVYHGILIVEAMEYTSGEGASLGIVATYDRDKEGSEADRIFKAFTCLADLIDPTRKGRPLAIKAPHPLKKKHH